jgi:hypothetical protein
MAAQSVPLRRGEHVDAGDDEVGLPRRTRPLRIGTHRVSKPEREEPSAFERARDSGWLAIALLAALALLLVVGAYVLGRAFASHVAGGSSSARLDPHVSRISVTGPSLTSSTAMSAPNTPVSTWVPASTSASRTRS